MPRLPLPARRPSRPPPPTQPGPQPWSSDRAHQPGRDRRRATVPARAAQRRRQALRSRPPPREAHPRHLGRVATRGAPGPPG
eukprot:401186-Alexandrium_andersonii.AAC.1